MSEWTQSVHHSLTLAATKTKSNQQQKLTASDAAPDDQFGRFVAISGDTVIIGAQFHDTVAGNAVGSAYVFVRNGTTWSEQQLPTRPP